MEAYSVKPVANVLFAKMPPGIPATGRRVDADGLVYKGATGPSLLQCGLLHAQYRR